MAERVEREVEATALRFWGLVAGAGQTEAAARVETAEAAERRFWGVVAGAMRSSAAGAVATQSSGTVEAPWPLAGEAQGLVGAAQRAEDFPS